MKRERNFAGRGFNSMNALEAAHKLLEWKRTPVFSDGDHLGVKNERLTLEIAQGDLNDFRNARSDFGKAPAPDPHTIFFFVNLNPRPIILELECCLSPVGLEDFFEVLRKLGKHGEKRHEELDIDFPKPGCSGSKSNNRHLGEIRAKKSGASHGFQVRIGSAGDGLLNKAVVQADAELVV